MALAPSKNSKKLPITKSRAWNSRRPVYQQNGTTRKQVGAGTGFVISSDGYILTNKHVVSDDAAEYTALLSDGKQKTAKVVYKDANNDLAIVKIDGANLPAVNLGDSA